ncbi:MAG: hypothetical protein Q9190_006890 [Brigantiaea leucoxantha]
MAPVVQVTRGRALGGPSGAVKPPSGGAPSEPSAAAVSSPPPIAEAAPEEQPVTVSAAQPKAATVSPQPSTKPANARLAMTAAVSGILQEERARAVFAKYGLTLEPAQREYAESVTSAIHNSKQEGRNALIVVMYAAQNAFETHPKVAAEALQRYFQSANGR